MSRALEPPWNDGSIQPSADVKHVYFLLGVVFTAHGSKASAPTDEEEKEVAVSDIAERYLSGRLKGDILCVEPVFFYLNDPEGIDTEPVVSIHVYRQGRIEAGDRAGHQPQCFKCHKPPGRASKTYRICGTCENSGCHTCFRTHKLNQDVRLHVHSASFPPSLMISWCRLPTGTLLVLPCMPVNRRRQAGLSVDSHPSGK